MPNRGRRAYRRVCTRIPEELYAALRDLADDEGRSISAQLVQFIRRGMSTKRGGRRPAIATGFDAARPAELILRENGHGHGSSIGYGGS